MQGIRTFVGVVQLRGFVRHCKGSTMHFGRIIMDLDKEREEDML